MCVQSVGSVKAEYTDIQTWQNLCGQGPLAHIRLEAGSGLGRIYAHSVLFNYSNYIGPNAIIVFISNGSLPTAGDYLKLFSSCIY